MNEKDKAIAQAMASIQNRLRHVYNQGFENGRKAERKTGKWKSNLIDTCSECHALCPTINGERTHTPYCPYCGAKMEGYDE